ncbi:SMC family ATPase [Echinicola jeungdonensis]|uniref:SMC family ATPase n=1 Tax=Echinicola jeungdonensis TaxID=709343 RepID=A0ABV5J739_9BACT|nr:SMC family ATPase [Echinicola jeungdonensis]MDN3668712.1 SMC family ATPase [Echinicola jeungdonensis]
MIPIKLEIQGLYSYQEKQTIDFTQLTAAGLFGIFGQVGSGKSSVLEAILLALYGNTERLSNRGERNSMVNLQSSVLSISLEFNAGKNNQNTYKASYQAKRDPKNFDNIKPAEHIFYHLSNGSWVPTEQKGEELVGMKMEHFRQTVIIPQGKFRDFIEQKPKERADMMKELFGLEKFDLADKTKRLMSQIRERKIQLETLLGGLEEYTEEFLTENLEQQKQLALKKEEQTKELTSKEAALQKANIIKEKAEQLAGLKNELASLEKKEGHYQQQRKILDQYQKALVHFKPLLDQIKEKEFDLEKYEVSVTDCERFKTSYEKSVEVLELKYQKLYEDYGKKGEKEARIRDLQQVKEFNKLLEQKLPLRQKYLQLEKETSSYQEKADNLSKKIQEMELQLEKMDVPEMEWVSQLENTYRELKQNIVQLEKLEGFQRQLENEKQAIDQNRKEILEGLNSKNDSLEAVIENENARLEKLEKERENLLQQKGLLSYTRVLEEGEPCPLCGSKDHPAPLHPDFDEDFLSKNHTELQATKNQLDKIRQAQTTLEKKQIQWETIHTRVTESQRETDLLAKRNRELIVPLEEKNLDSISQLAAHLDACKRVLKEEKALQMDLKKLRGEMQSSQREAEKDLAAFHETQKKLDTLTTRIEAKQNEVHYSDLLDKYKGVEESKIDTDIHKVKQYIEDLEVALPRAQDALKAERQKQATNLANLDNFKKQLKSSQENHQKLVSQLKTNLDTHGFENKEIVIQLLEKELDVDQIANEIKAFDRQKDLTLAEIQKLESQEAVKNFQPETFNALEQEYFSQKTILDKTKEALSLLQNKILEIKNKLAEKEQQQKELRKVENRENNLKELNRLFSGSGFVKFVSNIYLKELVQTANLRFMKLTKNNLSLDIDEGNIFWVTDHLNGGRKRLLKTLSGGQTFQASLCLALALAEKVKSLNRAEQSFFFLDEGFGALDKNALRIVFNTLKSLRHENRIVGIISHVEELQQEIEVYAQVELDGEKGSKIAYSF